MISARRVTVLTTATALGAASPGAGVSGAPSIGGDQTILIRNQGTASIFLGGPDVETTDGFELSETDPAIEISLTAGDALFAIAAAEQRVDVIELT